MQQHSVEQALANGAPVTCATCRLFHEGNMFCGQQECGGPGIGRDFPKYDGPIPRSRFAERCLVCGSPGPRFLIAGLDTLFGLCAKHRSVYKHVGAREGELIRPVTIIVAP